MHGAETITFFAPAFIWALDASFDVNKPVHSKTTSIPSSLQGKLFGSLSDMYVIDLPSTIILLSSEEILLSIFP